MRNSVLSANDAVKLFRTTEGNPLFIVETVRAGLLAKAQRWIAGESIQSPPEGVEQPAPPKVYAIIQSRLQQLSPPARGLVQVAAAIGRSFTHDLLVYASDHSEEEVVHILDELWQRRMILPHGAKSYDFSHDKIREVAYAQISPILRPQLHRRIAHALETLFATKLESVSPQIALHYAEAGITEKAIHYYHRGAEAAQRLFAHSEAIDYLSKGIGLLSSLEESPELRQLEVELQLTIGSSWMFVKGWWSAPEVVTAYSRALSLIQEKEISSQHCLALWGLHQIHIQGAHLDSAQEFAARLLTISQDGQDPAFPAIAHHLLGLNLYLRGEFIPAQEELERAIAPAVPLERDFHTINSRQVPAVAARSSVALNLWYLGYPDRAARLGQEAVMLARELRHPLELGSMLSDQAVLHQLRREPKAVREIAQESIDLCTEHNIPSYLARSTIILGWALTEDGRVEEGLDLMRKGFAVSQKMGFALRRPYYLVLMAEGNVRLGNMQVAFGLLDEAMAEAERTGQLYHNAELNRIKGKLLLFRGANLNEIQGYFSQAIEIAHQQQAKSLQLRAATNLAQLWQGQGRQSEAKELLDPIYSWFQEGLETADLTEAKALLDQLRSD